MVEWLVVWQYQQHQKTAIWLSNKLSLMLSNIPAGENRRRNSLRRQPALFDQVEGLWWGKLQKINIEKIFMNHFWYFDISSFVLFNPSASLNL